MQTINDRIAYALGVGREIDDQTRIAGLVELVKAVEAEMGQQIENQLERIEELEAIEVDRLCEQLSDLRGLSATVALLVTESVKSRDISVSPLSRLKEHRPYRVTRVQDSITIEEEE